MRETPLVVDGVTVHWEYYWEKYGTKGDDSCRAYDAWVQMYRAYIDGKMEKDDDEDFGERFFIPANMNLLIYEEMRKR